jgi:antitoxin component of RelBE/YafQ-DinJ toxin-antitoxin module
MGVAVAMPNAPKTPSRNVRISDDLWRAAQAKATELGETVSDVVRRALDEYVRS